jgi:hypothetical protein
MATDRKRESTGQEVVAEVQSHQQGQEGLRKKQQREECLSIPHDQEGSPRVEAQNGAPEARAPSSSLSDLAPAASSPKGLAHTLRGKNEPLKTSCRIIFQSHRAEILGLLGPEKGLRLSFKGSGQTQKKHQKCTQ